MCGIAGIVGDMPASSYRESLRRMTDAIRHRGPDGEGHRLFARCALGHRRLAVVDLSGGAQPMAGPDDRVAVTFNGEIYGYKDLRQRLAGYPFRTQSDTEVILALYDRYDRDAVRHLPGMFAFALWDDRSQQLFCARDRFGEKPLYYAVGRGGEFLFASEIKGILASGLVEPVLDPNALARYLQRQCVRADESVYANIHSLPPGHSLVCRDGRIAVTRYWTLPDTDRDVSMSAAVEELRALLHQAVARQLVADVPVGAFLSGGLDSSTICLAASALSKDLRTFSFDFEGDHSEVMYARAVAQTYGTRHVELAASAENVAEQLLRMQEVFDEPVGDSSAIPTYLLAREARKHVKVALTGDAGDELFGGYLWYKPLLWMEREGRVGLLKWVAARIVNRALGALRLPGAVAREWRIMGMSFGRQYGSVLDAHRAQLAFFDAKELKQLGLDPSGAEEGDASPGSGHSMDDVIRHDVSDYMAANNLMRTDRASMAHGLELRAPFLDGDLASFCISLPYRLKVSTDSDKLVLREAFSMQWPESIRNRSKQGFGAPIARWLVQPPIEQFEREYLLDRTAPIFDVLSPTGTAAALRQANPIQRWTLLVLGVWFAHRRTVLRASPQPAIGAQTPALGLQAAG